MKRNQPYPVPGQPSLARSQGMVRPPPPPPPPPAGPAPPLPAASAAFANYGYGPVAPTRNSNTTVNSGHTAPSQQTWQGQWQQQPAVQPQSVNAQSSQQIRPQPPRYAQHSVVAPPMPTPGPPYPAYNVPPHVYPVHQPQQAAQPQHTYAAYPRPGPLAYTHSPSTYNPSAPQISAPPNKKPRYDQSAMSAAAPMSYPPVAPTQPYGWSSPTPAQTAMAAPQPPVPANVAGWNQGHGPPASRGRGGVANMASRGRQGPPGAIARSAQSQRRQAPNASHGSSSARQNGPHGHANSVTRAQTHSHTPPFRRPSSSSSTHGGSQASQGPSRNASGNSKPGFSSQNSIPVSGSRVAAYQSGRAPPANGSNHFGPTGPSRLALSKYVSTDRAASILSSDNGSSSSSKRAHADFRVLSIEVKELSWVWSVHTSFAEQSGQTLTTATPDTSSAALAETLSADVRSEASVTEAANIPNASAQSPVTDPIESTPDEVAEQATQTSQAKERVDSQSLPASTASGTTMAPEHTVESSKASAEPEAHEPSVQRPVHGQDSNRLRFCFAAVANAGHEGGRTGQKVERDRALSSTPLASLTELNTEAKHNEEADNIDQPDSAHTGSPNHDAGSNVEPKAEQALSVDQPEDVRKPEDDLQQHPGPSYEKDTPPTNSEDATTPGAEPSDHVIETNAEIGPSITDSGDKDSQTDQPAVKSENEDVKTDTISSPEKGAPSRDKKPVLKGPAPISPNRIQITYAGARKRLAIDADAIKSVNFVRSEHRVEIVVPLSSELMPDMNPDYNIVKGILLETRESDQDNYSAVALQHMESIWDAEASSEAGLDGAVVSADVKDAPTVVGRPASEIPPFFRLQQSQLKTEVTEITIVVHLDPQSPWPEPAWLKRGDTNELLASLQRSTKAVARSNGSHRATTISDHVWFEKIQVVDPDPPPSSNFEGMLMRWVTESFIGGQKEREDFVNDFLAKRIKSSALVLSDGVTAHAKADETPISDADDAGEIEVATHDSKGEVTTDAETDAERDVRVARGFVEIVTRLIKGERIGGLLDTAPILSRSSGVTSAFLDDSGGGGGGGGDGSGAAVGALSVSWGGAAMLSLFDLGLRQCTSLLEGEHDTAARVAQRWRSEIGAMLMELPYPLVTKAIDLTWKDVLERQRRSGNPSRVEVEDGAGVLSGASGAGSAGGGGGADGPAGGVGKESSSNRPTPHRHFHPGSGSATNNNRYTSVGAKNKRKR